MTRARICKERHRRAVAHPPDMLLHLLLRHRRDRVACRPALPSLSCLGAATLRNGTGGDSLDAALPYAYGRERRGAGIRVARASTRSRGRWRGGGHCTAGAGR